MSKFICKSCGDYECKLEMIPDPATIPWGCPQERACGSEWDEVVDDHLFLDARGV